MKQRIKKRLKALETKFVPEAQNVVVVQQNQESDEEMDARLERWKQGEVVKGIDCGPYKGGEINVIYVVFVSMGDKLD